MFGLLTTFPYLPVPYLFIIRRVQTIVGPIHSRLNWLLRMYSLLPRAT